ncbi:MAG: hypothetical protein ACRD22_08225 [Terriglobia bacterium]
MPVEHFKSKEAYRKNLAYRHIHNIPFTAREVVVGGKEHAVKHSGRAVDKPGSKANRAYKRRRSSRSRR